MYYLWIIQSFQSTSNSSTHANRKFKKKNILDDDFFLYLDLYLCDDNGKLTIRLYNKRDYFKFPIVIFRFWAAIFFLHQLSVFMLKPVKYQDLIDRWRLLTTKL